MKPISTFEAGEILGVGSARVRQLVGTGKLHAPKFGRDLMLDEAEVLAFAETERKAGRPVKRPNYIAYWDDSAAVITPDGAELKFDGEEDINQAIEWANENGGVVSINAYGSLVKARPLKHSPNWTPAS